MSRIERFCTFRVGDNLFGLEVERVQEILRRQDITPLPLATQVVRGLINLRGQIVTAIDLRRVLGLPDRAPSDEEIVIVVRAGHDVVSLLADEAAEVIALSSEAWQPRPATLRGRPELVRAACPLPGRLLLALELEPILNQAFEPQGLDVSRGNVS